MAVTSLNRHKIAVNICYINQVSLASCCNALIVLVITTWRVLYSSCGPTNQRSASPPTLWLRKDWFYLLSSLKGTRWAATRKPTCRECEYKNQVWVFDFSFVFIMFVDIMSI